jgi:hypothetical protein
MCKGSLWTGTLSMQRYRQPVKGEIMSIEKKLRKPKNSLKSTRKSSPTKKKVTPTTETKTEGPVGVKSQYHTISGEVVLSIIETTLSNDKPFLSQELVVDAAHRSFGRGSVTVDRNGIRTLVLLEARQVELLLRLLRMVTHE